MEEKHEYPKAAQSPWIDLEHKVVLTKTPTEFSIELSQLTLKSLGRTTAQEKQNTGFWTLKHTEKVREL